MIPKEGQLLYRGCACDDFARVLRVGKDANGLDVLDIELTNQEHINDVFAVANPDENAGSGDQNTSLLRIVLPPDTKVVLKDVPWKAGSAGIRLFIAPDGLLCHRCTAIFYPHDDGVSPFEKDGAK